MSDQPDSAKFILTVEVGGRWMEPVQETLMRVAHRFSGRLTRSDYEDRGDHLWQIRRVTLRKAGRQR